jgi:hypothetical protein
VRNLLSSNTLAKQPAGLSAVSTLRCVSSGLLTRKIGLASPLAILTELNTCAVFLVCLQPQPLHYILTVEVSLPELIAQTNMDQQSVNRLREELAKMTNWLGKNALEYFASEYETPSQNYIDKARS